MSAKTKSFQCFIIVLSSREFPQINKKFILSINHSSPRLWDMIHSKEAESVSISHVCDYSLTLFDIKNSCYFLLKKVIANLKNIKLKKKIKIAYMGFEPMLQVGQRP